MIFRGVILGVFAVLAMNANPARAQTASPPSALLRQSLDDAWWTGPMLANSAATLPRGHLLIEPYFYDVRTANSSGYGSLSYWLYGLANRFTVGMIPTVGYNQVSNGPDSSGIRFGDFTLLAQYGLTKFHEGRWVPTTGLMVQETFPTGKYDRLGARPSDGFGSGAYTTTVALNSQTFFWLPNGRILRVRLNVLQAFSNTVNVSDVSVYGTAAGFRGHAMPGYSTFVDAAGEYSMTKKWVLALDAAYRHGGNTRTVGFNSLDPTHPSILLDSGSSDAVIFAPAIEYNWKSNLGVLLGTRVIEVGHNVTHSISPAVAINFVH
jgi:hypothetical protein